MEVWPVWWNKAEFLPRNSYVSTTLKMHHIDTDKMYREKATTKIWLSLRKNATQTTTTIHYDWALLNNKDIRNKYVIALGNKFNTLREKTETHTPNDEYENFVNAHLEAAAKYIPTKHRTKSSVPWETLAVREKRADVKTASKCNR